MEGREKQASEYHNASKRKIATANKGEKVYKQAYRHEWALLPEFCKWLTKGKTDDTAHCKICRCEIQARMATIRIHGKSSKHTSLMSTSTGSSKVSKCVELSIFVVSAESS